MFGRNVENGGWEGVGGREWKGNGEEGEGKVWMREIEVKRRIKEGKEMGRAMEKRKEGWKKGEKE